MLSSETQAIIAKIREADAAIAHGDFATARDIEADLAACPQMGCFGAEIVGMAIDRAREKQGAAP